MKILLVIPVIILLVFLYYRISKNTSGSEDQLPKAFTNYHSIGSTNAIKALSVQMSLLLESKKNIELFLTSENNVIVSGLSGENENSFIKIAPDGNITDTLSLISRPEDIIFLKGFIIDKQA